MQDPNLKIDMYLDELKVALRAVEGDVAKQIFQEVETELLNLEPHLVNQRIQELGNPFDIALHADSQTPKTSFVLTWRYAFIGALFYSFGWIIFSIPGWLVGIGMIYSAKIWTSEEKRKAIIFPLIADIAAALIMVTLFWLMDIKPGNPAFWSILVIMLLVAGVTSMTYGIKLCARGIGSQRAHKLLSSDFRAS